MKSNKGANRGLRFISVADDLTGAADSGSYFTDRGMELTIYTGLPPEELNLPETGNFAVNLSTRNAPKEDAFDRHYCIFRKIPCAPDQIVMKKIGTGFRGRDPYEIGGMLAADPGRVCFIVDSAPDLGTFTLYGNQYCEGCILTKSLYACDPVFPPKCSYIPDILREGLECEAVNITIDAVKGSRGNLAVAVEKEISRGIRVLVFDAVTREDGLRLVSTLAPLYPNAVWTGSLGIGAALADYLGRDAREAGEVAGPGEEREAGGVGPGEEREAGEVGPGEEREAGEGVEPGEEREPGGVVGAGEAEAWEKTDLSDRCVCFTATAYEATRRQILYSRARGLCVVSVDIDRILDGDKGAQAEAVAEYLDKIKYGNVILVPAVETYSYKEGTSGKILSVISECANAVCRAADFDRLAIIGGETAQCILDLLDIHVIELKQPPEVGVALGTVKEGAYRGKRIALKGGSIGSEAALEKMMGKAQL